MKKQTNKEPKKEGTLKFGLYVSPREMDYMNSEGEKIEMPDYNQLQMLGADLVKLEELVYDFTEDDKVIRKIGEKLSSIAPLFHDIIHVICHQ